MPGAGAWAQWSGAALVAVAAVVAATRGQALPALVALAIVPSLPVADALPSPWPGAGLVLTLLLVGARAGVLLWRAGRDIPQSLTRWSIKEAVDTLPVAVLCADRRGRVQLVSSRMAELMRALLGTTTRNSDFLWDRLATGRVAAEIRTDSAGDTLTCRLPDGHVWLFARSALPVAHGRYHQIVATDVTQESELTALLQARQDELREQEGALRDQLATVAEVCRHDEILRATARVHDVLSGRLTLLLRRLESDPSDLSGVADVLESLRADLRTPGPDRDAPTEFASLARTYATIGVRIDAPDGLPDRGPDAELAIDVLREATANAVRHGRATAVVMRCRREPHRTTLAITHDGALAGGASPEGGGIAGMRQRVLRRGGTLRVDTRPRFTVTVELPKGEACA